MFDTRKAAVHVHRDEKRAMRARPRCFLYSRIITIIGARTCASVVLYLASEIVGTGVKGEKDEAAKRVEGGRKERRTSADLEVEKWTEGEE